MQAYSSYPPTSYWQPTASMLTDEDDVKKGIWPASAAFWLTCFYIALFIIRPWEVLLPWLTEIRFERTFVLVLILVVALQRGFKIRMDAQTLAVLNLAGAFGICTLNAFNPQQAWSGTAGLYVYLTTIFGYFLFNALVRTRYELTFLITCQLVATGVYLAKSLWEFYIHGNGYVAMGVLRLQGIDTTNSHPNSVASTIVLSLPVWVFIWKMRESFTSTWPSFWQVWFGRSLLAFLGMGAVALMATNSRGGVLAAVVYGILFVRRQSSFQRQVAYFVAFLAVASIVWMVIPEDSRDRIRSIWDKKAANESAQESAEGRVIGLQQGIEMFRRFPLTGVGIDNFITYRVQWLDGTRLDAHNLAGELLAQTGLLGTGAFLIFAATMAWNSRYLMGAFGVGPNDPPEYYRELGYMGRDTLLLLFFQGITAHNALRFNWIWMAAFLAIATRMCREERGE